MADMEVKRGPGRPPNPTSPPKVEPKGTMVTYVPRDGDNAKTSHGGVEFVANKPVEVKNQDQLKQLAANPWFNVAGQETQAVPVSDDLVRPVDSEGYRRYAVAWFKTMTSSAAMKDRWASEEGLRASCGVGSDDLTYLNNLYVPRLADLTKAEG